MTEIKLCPISALDKTRAKGLEIQLDGQTTEIFLVKDEHGIYGYINHCPHRGSPLEWREDDFLDEAGQYIMCATHAAHFRIHDGYCVAGPCKNKQLTSLNLDIKNDTVFLQEPVIHHNALNKGSRNCPS